MSVIYYSIELSVLPLLCQHLLASFLLEDGLQLFHYLWVLRGNVCLFEGLLHVVELRFGVVASFYVGQLHVRITIARLYVLPVKSANREYIP